MRKSQLLSDVQEIIYYLRIQNYHEGAIRFRSLLEDMQEEPTVRIEIFSEQGFIKKILAQMLQALESDDMILLADLLEEALVPALKALVVPQDDIEYGNYQLEITSSGYFTVRHYPTNLYLHTNGNPMEEARILVDKCFDCNKQIYAVWGCGLGYHVAKLFDAARGAISIMVFDEDETILQLARCVGVLDNIPKDRLTFIHDYTGQKFVKYIAENDVGILLHFPSIKKIQNKELKDALQSFFPAWNGGIQFKNEFAINFRSNYQRCVHNVDELKFLFHKKEVVLVAAGPSLDSSFDFLKGISGKKTIIAVTTVLKKLLQEGIVPDCAIVMDSQKRTLGHIQGIEHSQVPLIIDSTAYWEFADRYVGEKYIAYQEGYEAAEKCAHNCKLRLYETGGSVITLALDIILQLGASQVYFVGVDLAYPKGISHASGTMDMKQRDVSGMKLVKDVHSEQVYADSLFIGYRKWMEAKIEKYPWVKFYNLSNCGAEIAGAISWNFDKYKRLDPE